MLDDDMPLGIFRYPVYSYLAWRLDYMPLGIFRYPVYSYLAWRLDYMPLGIFQYPVYLYLLGIGHWMICPGYIPVSCIFIPACDGTLDDMP